MSEDKYAELYHTVAVSNEKDSESEISVFGDHVDEETFVTAASHTLVVMADNADSSQKEFIKKVIEDYKDARHEIVEE
jgi:hypothetical protein